MNQWLSLTQAAQVAGVGRTTLHDALVRGELPCTPTSLGRLVHRDDALDWKASREQQKQKEAGA